MIGPEAEALRMPATPGEADAVTVSFADSERGVCGLVRLGVAHTAEDEGVTGTALAVLFRDYEPVAALARGGLPVDGAPDWAAFSAGPLRHVTDAPLERWRLTWEGDDQGLDLELEAVSAPAELGEEHPVATAGGLAGYGQLVRVRGTVRVLGETVTVEGTGQRDRAWGVADWDRLELARTVSAWYGGAGVMLQALRPVGAAHDGEAVWAQLVRAGEPEVVAEPRLSTTYDGDGHQRRVGLELWMDATDDDGEEVTYPVRAAGEIVCGSSLELGALRLDVAFVRWHLEGASGVGRYDVLRRAAD